VPHLLALISETFVILWYRYWSLRSESSTVVRAVPAHRQSLP